MPDAVRRFCRPASDAAATSILREALGLAIICSGILAVLSIPPLP